MTPDEIVSSKGVAMTKSKPKRWSGWAVLLNDGKLRSISTIPGVARNMREIFGGKVVRVTITLPRKRAKK
jgi:hypothetical protein